jgi:hypothetical protein
MNPSLIGQAETKRGTTGRWLLYAGIIAAIWLSYTLYAGTLSFPFLQEDVSHIRWLEWHSPLQIFLSAEGAPAYRPLGKFIIKLWDIILGEHNRAWLRYHNLLFNALGIALAGRLIAWIDRRPTRYATGGFAALLFAALPFAYQAIPWINNFFYPLINLLLLLLTTVYWQARVRNNKRLLALALFLAVITPFQIEYGVMGFCLLFMVEVVLWWQGRQQKIWWWGPLFGLLMNGLFVLIWFTIPKESYFFGLPTPERIFQITTYLLQGLMYPLAPISQWLVANWAVNDILAIWLVCLPGLIVVLWLVWRTKGRGYVAAVLIWFVTLNLPTLVILDFDYVVNSPRLLYPAGLAICWLWAAVLALPLSARFSPFPALVPRVAALVLLLLFIMPGIGFVQERLDHYRLVEQPVEQLRQAALAAQAQEDLLLVNFPSWLTPAERHFALGNHGVQLIPEYIGIEDFIFAHTGRAVGAQTVQFANLRATLPYFSGLHGRSVDYEGLRTKLLAAGDVYLTQYTPEQIELLPAGRVTGLPARATVAQFGDHIALEAVSTRRQGDAIELVLQWRLLGPVNDDLSVFTHLYAGETLVAQDDGYPLQGLAPFWLWSPGQALRDVRRLLPPEASTTTPLSIGIGVYHPATGERLPVIAGGERQPDDTFRFPLENGR